MRENARRFLPAVRIAAPVVGALTLSLAAATTAVADPATVSRDDGKVKIIAEAGEENHIFVGVMDSTLFVRDTGAELTAGPGCEQVDDYTVTCGKVRTVKKIFAHLDDLDDTFFVSNLIKAKVRADGGKGEDIVDGGAGDDRLRDPDGWLKPVTENTFQGDQGDDKIKSRNHGFDRVDCGKGWDKVIADKKKLDRVNDNCEKVKRPHRH